MTQRINESVDVYNDILSKPFDYEINENFNSESEELDYVSSRNEMYERWRKQLKFTTLSSYHDLLSDQQSKVIIQILQQNQRTNRRRISIVNSG